MIQLNPPASAAELLAAYKASGLRRIRIGLREAYDTPHLRAALEIQIAAMRKEQQHGTPAPAEQVVEETIG